ncbi:MAG: VOC family protein [Planctomycetota bacterium]
MASIRKDITVRAPATAAWDAVRDYKAVHTRLVPGMVTDTKLEDDGAVRIVTFADGLVLRERVLSVDDKARRFAYSIDGEPFVHHNASVEIFGDDRWCRIVWTADMLPHEMGETVAKIMDRGLALSKQTIEADVASTKGSSDKTPSDHTDGASAPEASPLPDIVSEQIAKATDPRYGAIATAAHRINSVFCATNRPTLHHISLFVSDVDASIAFYTTGLGLALTEHFSDIVGQRAAVEFPFRVASVFLEAGHGRYIELHPAGERTMSPPSFPMNHLAIAVADVDAAYDRAIAAGASAAEIPVTDEHWDGTPLDVLMTGERPEPMRMAFLQGPDGELIELYESRDSY